MVAGLRQPILYSFVLDKPPGYKVFWEPEPIQFKKVNKFALKTITFYLEDDNHEEANFNGETLTFTLQLIKNQYNVFTYNYMSLYICLYVHLYEYLWVFIFLWVMIIIYTIL